MSPPKRHPLLLPTLLFVGFTAAAGGGLLLADPSGGHLSMPTSLLDDSPFSDFLVPGAVLAFLVAGSAFVAAYADLARVHWADKAARIAALVLLGWMVGELVFVGEFVALQALYVVLGGLMLWWARPRPPLPVDTDEAARRFLAEKRVALIGLSSHPEDFSQYVAKALRERGVEVVAVNKSHRRIGDEEAWPRVSAIPNPPKAALLMIPPEGAEAAVRDCIAAGVERVWFHRGAGAPGAASPAAVALARTARMTVITDLCPMMALDPDHVMHGAHRAIRALELDAERRRPVDRHPAHVH